MTQSCAISAMASLMYPARSSASMVASAWYSSAVASSLHQPWLFWPANSFSSVGIWSLVKLLVRYCGSGGAVLIYMPRS